MNKKIIVLSWFLFMTGMIYGNDSLHIEKRFQELKSSMQKNDQAIRYQIDKSNRNFILLNARFDELEENNQKHYEGIQNHIERNSQNMDSLKAKALSIQNQIQSFYEAERKAKITSWIFQLVAIGLILFLIVYSIFLRNRSVEMISLRAEKLADGNNEILRKAGELKAIKKSLNELLDQQQKIKKSVKRKKKK